MAKAKARGYIDERPSTVDKNIISYRVKIRVRCAGWPNGYYPETATFETRRAAKEWRDQRIKHLDLYGIPTSEDVILRKEKLDADKLSEVRLEELILHYLNEPENEKEIIGDSKYYGLKKILKYRIVKKRVSTLRKSDLDEFCKERRFNDKVTGYTAYMDIGYIKSVIYCAKDYGINGSVKFIEDTIKSYRKTYKDNPKKCLVAFAAKPRETTISERDLEIFREGLRLREEHRAAHIPYLTILNIAISTCMRISEICRITWADFKDDTKTLMIRQRKHPIEPKDQLIPLISGAYEILKNRKIKAMQSKHFSLEDRIFPYKADSVGAGWTNVRKKLIKEGHNLERIVFHDLRAHGATELLKNGWDIKKVSIVTGHTNLDILSKIYSRLKPFDIVKEYEDKEIAKKEALTKV